MLVLDPGNSYVLLLRGKAALEGDDPKNAISYLEKAADLDSHPDGLRDLLKAYLRIASMDKAAPIAEKLLTVHNDPEGLFLMAEACARLGQYHEALDLYTRHADRLLAADSAKLLATLHSMISHVRDDAGALETLLTLLNKAGESTHLNEITELLAHSCVKSGNLSRARDLYQMLATSEPQNQVHLQNYQQVLDLMDNSSSTPGITPEEGTMIIEELEATSPVIDQAASDEVAIAVRSAVTDADLFLSYNLPEKAIVPLLQVLPQAPRDARLNQRLAMLHTRFKRFTEAAVCCRTLESVYHDAGFPDEAVRYGELAGRYEQSSELAASKARTANEASKSAEPLASRAAAAGVAVPWPVAAPEASSMVEFSVGELTVEAPSDAHETSAEFSVAEVPTHYEESISKAPSRLAAEAADIAEPTAALNADNPEIAETVEEVRFYLEHFMTEQARAGIEKLETLTRDASILEPLRAALASAAQPATEVDSEITEISIDADEPGEAVEFDCEVEGADGSEMTVAPEFISPQPTHDHTNNIPVMEVAPAPENDDEPGFADAAHNLGIQGAAPVQAAVSHQGGVLDSLVADLEASLGDAFPQASPPETQVLSSPAPTNQTSADTVPGWPVEATAAPARGMEPKTAAATNSFTAQAPVSAGPANAPAVTAAPAAAAKSTPAVDSVDLSEMFGELKQELEEEVAAGDDDPETHYNLGVAFREMGLLDEAIAELQKVCTSIERGHPFAQPVQTYTWLAQCFLDKGVPEAAIRWYEKALGIPGLDAEARLAINYELGSACETASDKPAALRHFTDVYGTNIDYRDVAQRIQALKS
jgi:tetratricopeptide (TPR) repeat protein